MFPSELFLDRQRLLVSRFGLSRAAGIAVQIGQMHERSGQVLVKGGPARVSANQVLPQVNRFLVRGLGLGGTPLFLVEVPQTVPALGQIILVIGIRAYRQQPLLDGHGPLVGGLRRPRLAELGTPVAHIEES
jgi:hypothetical protein